MKLKVVRSLVLAAGGLLLASLAAVTPALAQSNLALRVMAANITSGNNQSYLDHGVRIFQGLKPDIVCIQEFNTTTNTIREFVDLAFGADFQYFRESESGYNIPNGVISRWPIIASDSWDDSESPNRGYAWAQIDLPGTTNDLYVVSVHLLTANASTRNAEATELKNLIQANFPAKAWVIVGGDMNTDTRSEASISTFKTFLSDSPQPHDGTIDEKEGTNASREKPYDYVLPSFSLTNYHTPLIIGARSFPNGLVFDSRVYSPLGAVAPVLAGDSGAANMQHMAVLKDFLIPVSGGVNTNPPSITTQPLSQTNAIGGNVTFTVAASGATPLAYQWRLHHTNLSGATAASLSLTNIQPVNAGDYTVVITNAFGSITSSVATLTVNAAPVINTQPQSLAVHAGANATFTVAAAGGPPLFYQWRFKTVNISSATNASYTRTNAQLADAGDYTVVITNVSGSITSGVAVLTVNQSTAGQLVTLAGWNVSGLSAYGPSPLPPTTNAANITVTGLTRGAGVGTSGTAAGSAWGGNGFDSTTAVAGIAAGDFATFSIAANAGYTVSFTNLSRFDYRRSSGGPPSGVLQYQVGSGSFNDITTLSYPAVGTGDSIGVINLSSIAPLQNVSATNTVTFRIVNYGASGSGGTWYIFNTINTTAPDFSIDGTVNPISVPPGPPASAPALTNAALVGTQFQFTLTGSATSNYVVQATTNLDGGFWRPVRTNAAPFTFVETNALNSPQHFYRGMVAP